MTEDSKKAIEIAHKESHIYGIEDSTLECYNSAMDMAEYKDKQFKEYLENFKKRLLHNDEESLLIDMVINGLFNTKLNGN